MNQTVNFHYFRVCDLLDCTLQTLNLTSDVVLVDTEEDELHYDELSHDQSPHLLDTLQSFKVVDGDTMSLFYQLTLVSNAQRLNLTILGSPRHF